MFGTFRSSSRHCGNGEDEGCEARLSNFLLYQAAYSELFFTDVYFPSFRRIDFFRIIRDYQRRQRRFGK